MHTFKGASRDFHLDPDGRAAELGNLRACSETDTDPVALAGVLLVAGRAAALAFPGRTRSAVPAGSGRRALRAAKRAHVSAPLECIDAVKGLDKFEQCFTPHRRVISCDSDLLALNVFIPSVCRVCSSSGFGCACVSVSGGACCGSSRCSRCGRAIVFESGALCRVCADGTHQSVVSFWSQLVGTRS